MALLNSSQFATGNESRSRLATPNKGLQVAMAAK